MQSRTAQRLAAASLLGLAVVFGSSMQASGDGSSSVAQPPVAAATMPVPEAYPTPAATPAPAVTFRASTIRLRAGKYQLYRFGRSGNVLDRRNVQLARPRVWSTPAQERMIGTGRWVKLASGPHRGWWVAAGSTQPATMVAAEQNVTVRAGRLVARRFFGPVTTRRVAYLPAPASFKSSRRAVFNSRTHYLIDDGPLAGRWVVATRIATSGSSDSSAPTAAPTASAAPAAPASPAPSASPTSQPTPLPSSQPSAPLSTWKTLVMLYRETDVTFKRSNGSDYRLQARMNNTMYDLVRKTLGQFAKSTTSWSGGMAAMDMTILDMPHPLNRLDQMGGGTYWAGPTAVQDDLQAYAPKGTYDSVIVMFQPTDADGVSIPIGAWGLTIPDGSWSNNAGFSSIVTPHELWWWTSSSAPEEVFVHEWMHQVIFFHERHGRTDIDLHAGERYGYKDTNGSWKTWLVDLMQGKVKDGDRMVGITADVWAAGQPTAP